MAVGGGGGRGRGTEEEAMDELWLCAFPPTTV